MSALPVPTCTSDPLRSRAMMIAAIAALPILLTYLWLVGFAYPTSDDWCFAASGRDAGVFASLSAYWNGNGGRWLTALLLYGLGWIPLIQDAYPLLIALTIGGFIAANGFVARCLGATGWRTLLMATVIISTVQIIALPVLDIGNLGPHLATPETLYWVNGAWPYSLAYTLLAVAAWMIITPLPRWLAWGGCIIIGAAVSGLSEMAGILGVILGTALGLGGCRRGWVLAVAAGLGFGIASVSPGNLARLAILRNEVKSDAGVSQLPAALLAGLRFSLVHLRDWLLNPAVASLAVGLATWGACLPATPESWRRRFIIASATVILGTWVLAIPALALVGFLEARHEGLISFAAVAGIMVTAVLAGHAWPGLRTSRPLHFAAAAWVVGAAAYRWWWPIPMSPLGGWADLALLAGLVGMMIVWVRGRPVLLGCAFALALLGQPAWWQAIADGCGKAPKLLHLQQFRDRTVLGLVAGGGTDIILPWLGANERLPRTMRIYEVQDGWMADGYAAYFGIRHYRFSDRILVPILWHRRPAPATTPGQAP